MLEIPFGRDFYFANFMKSIPGMLVHGTGLFVLERQPKRNQILA